MNMHKSLIAAAVTVFCSLSGGYALAATATDPSTAPKASVQPVSPSSVSTEATSGQPLDTTRETAPATHATTTTHHTYPSFAHLDKGKLGYLTAAETRHIKGFDFTKADTNGNGKLSKAEYDAQLKTLEQNGHAPATHDKAPAAKQG